ncbi:HCP-like protein, partial [Nadsonia fulvescens var. elongata DSM 6958]
SASSSVSDLHYRSSSVDRSQNTLSNSHHNYLHSRTRSVSSFRAASLTGQASQLAASSMFDLNQSYLTPHLGANASSALMPRIKTIELYRKNAKKSNDPVIQFQFSQYMLQTALLSGTATAASSASEVLSPSSSQDDLNFLSPEVMSPSSSLSQAENSDTKIKAALLKEAIQNLKKLADKGFADAQYLLGDAYASGALGKPDAREAFGYFIMAAKHGHAESSYRVSLCLEEGWGTSKDIRRAHNFLRSSATKGHPGAMFRLGMSCYYGRLNLGHSDNNKLEGAKWLTRASDSANEIFARAPFELAKIYETGYKDLIIMDHQYSVQLYVRSADLHYIPAVAKLGQCYEIGLLGCPQDPALSIHYYTIAALAGDASSMLAMCAWYMVGAEPNLPQNEEEAFEWAKRAAILNWPKAQYAVAYFLENGIGTETDIYEAAGWYRKAAANGDEKAKKRLENQNFNNGATGAPTDKGKVKKKKSAKDKDCIIM